MEAIFLTVMSLKVAVIPHRHLYKVKTGTVMAGGSGEGRADWGWGREGEALGIRGRKARGRLFGPPAVQEQKAMGGGRGWESGWRSAQQRGSIATAPLGFPQAS